MVTPALGATSDKVELSLAELAALLRADAVTRELAENVTYFSEPRAAETVLGKGPGDSQGFLLTTAPLLWRPAAGATFLIACGVISLTTEPHHPEDKSGMLLLVLGMCWMGLSRAGEWWGADRKRERERERMKVDEDGTTDTALNIARHNIDDDDKHDNERDPYRTS